MLLTILLMPRADDIDDSDAIEASYVWEQESVVTVSWVKIEDFGE